MAIPGDALHLKNYGGRKGADGRLCSAQSGGFQMKRIRKQRRLTRKEKKLLKRDVRIEEVLVRGGPYHNETGYAVKYRRHQGRIRLEVMLYSTEKHHLLSPAHVKFREDVDLEYSDEIKVGHRVWARDYEHGFDWDWLETGTVTRVGNSGYLRVQWDEETKRRRADGKKPRSVPEIVYVTCKPFKVMVTDDAGVQTEVLLT